MSIWLERSNSEALAASHAAALAAPDLPISITCWVYVEAEPGEGEAHTVWWFGRDGINSQFVKLVFEADTQGAIKFRASFQAANNTATATATGYAVGVWHCVSVVVEERTSPSEYRLRLYLDDDAPVDDSTTASGAAVDDYDIFAVGRTSGATKIDYASCRVEHIAIWKGPATLSASDNTTMFTGRVPAWEGNTLDVGKRPDLACWMLAAHARSGLRVRNQEQARPTYGELWNEVDDNANQQVQTGVSAPRWSAKTPIFRWKFQRNPTVSADRVPNTPRSRLQPRFVFFLLPELGRSSLRWPDSLTGVTAPLWDHPNFDYLGQTQFHNAGAARPPGGLNQPRSDLAVVAATMADWLAYQGFAAGSGSEGGGQYEGSLYLRGIGRGETIAGDEEGELNLLGWDTPNDPSNPFGIEGAYTHIPLLQHPFDHIDQVTSGDKVKDIWNVWFTDHGVALCREWSEHFWQALLKEELDERGLCYPARLHWDYEHQPNENSAMSAGAGTAADPIGNWGAMLDDPRADDADHPVYVEPGPAATEWTLKDVDNSRSGPLDPADSPWNDNIDATNWLGGWIIAMRNSAFYRRRWRRTSSTRAGATTSISWRTIPITPSPGAARIRGVMRSVSIHRLSFRASTLTSRRRSCSRSCGATGS